MTVGACGVWRNEGLLSEVRSSDSLDIWPYGDRVLRRISLPTSRIARRDAGRTSSLWREHISGQSCISGLIAHERTLRERVAWKVQDLLIWTKP